MGRGSIAVTPIVERVIGAAPRRPWSGTVYRVHGPTWNGDDPGGSLNASGRWGIGGDDPFGRSPFPVLYAATSAQLATWEYIRHSKRDTADEIWRRLRTATTHLAVDLPSVLDLREPSKLGLAPGALIGDDYSLPQEIAIAAYALGLSGILAPTATGLGVRSGDHNVIVFFEATGTTAMIYGFPTPGTRPRPGVGVGVLYSEEVRLPP